MNVMNEEQNKRIKNERIKNAVMRASGRDTRYSKYSLEELKDLLHKANAEGDNAETIILKDEIEAKKRLRDLPVKTVFEQRLKADKNTEAFAYAVLEACYAHRDDMQIVNDVLFYKGRPFKVSGENVRSLANTPRTVSTATARWVYDNLKRLVPKTDETLMEIMPGVVWNSRIVRFSVGDTDD